MVTEGLTITAVTIITRVFLFVFLVLFLVFSSLASMIEKENAQGAKMATDDIQSAN